MVRSDGGREPISETCWLLRGAHPILWLHRLRVARFPCSYFLLVEAASVPFIYVRCRTIAGFLTSAVVARCRPLRLATAIAQHFRPGEALRPNEYGMRRFVGARYAHGVAGCGSIELVTWTVPD